MKKVAITHLCGHTVEVELRFVDTARRVECGSCQLEEYEESLDWEREDEDEPYVYISNEMLEDQYWNRCTPRETATHLAEQAANFRNEEDGSLKKGKVATTVTVAVVTGAGAAVCGAGVLLTLGIAACGSLLADVVVTGLEEAGATRRLGRGIRSLFNRIA
jgi:hypothetical protein